MRSVGRFAAGLALAAAVPAAAQVRVRQGTGEWSIAPLDSSQPIVAFYSYGTVKPASAFCGLETSDESLLFFHRHTGSGDLSLVFLHDLYEDGTGGAAEFRVAGLPSGATWQVRDDPGGGGPGGDSYVPDPPSGGATTATWAWNACCTDGGAIGGLEGRRFCASVEPDFGSGIGSWQLIDGPAFPGSRIALPRLDRTAWLCQDCHDLTCPVQVVAECTGGGVAFVNLSASGGSLCAGSRIDNDRTGGGPDASDVYPLGTTQVAFTLGDNPGFESTCDSMVEVRDTLAPQILSCPAPLALPCEGKPVPASDPRVVAWAGGFAAADLCGPTSLANDLPAEIPPTCGGPPLVVTFIATDAFSHAASCTSTVTLEDRDPPTVTGCPAAVALECDDPAGVPRSDPRLVSFFAAFTATDDCGDPSLSDDAPAVFASGCGSGFETAVEFTAEDACARTATCSSTVTVHDTTPPDVVCPADATVECRAQGGTPASTVEVAAWRQSATATDACGAAALADDLPALLPAGCAPGHPTTVAFTASDDCSLQAACTATLRVVDSTPPAILVCPAPLALECRIPGGVSSSDSDVQAFLASFFAADVCGTTTTANDAPALLPSGCAPGTTTTIAFTADDDCANRSGCSSTVTVADTTAPTITSCPAPLTLECDSPGGLPAGDPRIQAWLAGFAAGDLCGPATLSNDAPAFFPASCGPGTVTTVHFEAEDGCGNAATCSATLTLKDASPPVITACPAPLELECDSPGGIPAGDPRIQSWLASFAAVDGCGGTKLTSDAPAFFASGCGPGQATTVEFSATDDCGQVANCTSSVTVRDTTAPVIAACPAALELECDGPGGIDGADPRIQAWRGGFAAADACGAVTLGDDAPARFPAGCGPGHATTVEFTATDACGLEASCTSTVTVRDTEPPVVTSCPAPIALECSAPGGVPSADPAVVTWAATFAARDVCHGTRLGNDLPALLPSGCGAGRTTAVAFTAEDDCGNPGGCGSTVTVRDRTPPAITTCPAPLVLECDSPGGIPAGDPRIQAWLASFAAADVCDGATLSNDAPAFFPSGCAPGATTTVRFTAVDDCANAASCASSITVVDSTPPEVTRNGLDGLCLWPPNHKYYCAGDLERVIDARDLCDVAPPVIRVVACRSNQPDDAPERRGDDNGDGHTTGDCLVRDSGREVCLRAERLGGDPAGRTYEVEIEVADGCDNRTRTTARIEVPHDQAPHRDCVRAEAGRTP